MTDTRITPALPHAHAHAHAPATATRATGGGATAASGPAPGAILPREILIHTIAGLLEGVHHVAVGAASPIPAAGAMLRRALDDGRREVRLSILGSVRHNFFTNGSAELFDSAAQGRLDAFFLSGGQIDGQANVNLVGTGRYPQVDVR